MFYNLLNVNMYNKLLSVYIYRDVCILTAQFTGSCSQSQEWAEEALFHVQIEQVEIPACLVWTVIQAATVLPDDLLINYRCHGTESGD